ncbi:hypothetical protein [Streptomyces sp. NPDC088736]|uniref:hypothetical protein n=1 Tax=Streptomyces sp. NPDC088736 TaxID=3365881 RepID=UPI0038089ADA
MRAGFAGRSADVLVWDNVRLHLTAGMRDFIEANAEWLTVFQLPTCAPDLNRKRVCGRWSSATLAPSPQPASGGVSLLALTAALRPGAVAGTLRLPVPSRRLQLDPFPGWFVRIGRRGAAPAGGLMWPQRNGGGADSAGRSGS